MSPRTEYQKAMEEHLAQWRKRLDTLGEKARIEMKMKVEEELAQWKSAGNRAAIKLEELRCASADAWTAIKVEMEDLWQKMEVSLAKGEARRRAHDVDQPGATHVRPQLTLVAPPPDAGTIVLPAPTPKQAS